MTGETDRAAVTVTVPVDLAPLVANTLRVGIAELIRADRTRTSGPAYDARGPLQLAAALDEGNGETPPPNVTSPETFVIVGNGTRTGVPARTVHNWIAAGRVIGKKCECGRTWLARLADLEREIDRRKAQQK